MRKAICSLSALAAVIIVVGAAAAGNLKSGPQVGERVPGPFHPLNCTGENAGEKFCLYCKNGQNPVAMILARQTSPELTKLIKKIDEATAKNKDHSMGSFVVFLSDSDKLEGELKELAKKEKLQQCVLSIDNPAGPEGYKVAKDADVTVVLYSKGTVRANHAFNKGELRGKAIDAIMADIPKIVSSR
ncbi:MAG: hypothetical protein L0215_19805 [Gemmataceae bacterium]|nr:hypothetical protein [Gemmataceae bacterium]MCI0419665.1 hypothetical protein [Acidobacteriota bacterium]